MKKILPNKSISIILSSIITISSLTGCNSAKSFERDLGRIVAPYEFSLLRWEIDTMISDFEETFEGKVEDEEKDVATVREYFSTAERIRELDLEIENIRSGKASGNSSRLQNEIEATRARRHILEKQAEQVLERQIGETLSELGIYNPLDVYANVDISFPPVSFELTEPPYLLVTSPRDRIETLKTVMLQTEIPLDDREKLESEADGLGVSSLVVKLGGIATYPSFVSNRGDLRWVLDTACEEWLHQYLSFRPLGFRYIMHFTGLIRDYDAAALDETVASMTGKEIGGLVYNRYYSTPAGIPPEDSGSITAPPTFDFNREMQEIRTRVDELLTEGKIEAAESYMEERRQYLAANGYFIRKLNQAYFAFFGCYCDSPTSVDPIGDDLKELRDRSGNIKNFLDLASFITSREGLKESLNLASGQVR